MTRECPRMRNRQVQGRDGWAEGFGHLSIRHGFVMDSSFMFLRGGPPMQVFSRRILQDRFTRDNRTKSAALPKGRGTV